MRSMIEFVAVVTFAFLCSVLAGVVGLFYIKNSFCLDIICINISCLCYLWAAANLEIKQEGV